MGDSLTSLLQYGITYALEIGGLSLAIVHYSGDQPNILGTVFGLGIYLIGRTQSDQCTEVAARCGARNIAQEKVGNLRTELSDKIAALEKKVNGGN